MNRFVRGSSSVFINGVSWCAISLMPARNGAWNLVAFAALTALHFCAFRYAPNCDDGSIINPRAVGETVRLRLHDSGPELEIPRHVELASGVVVL